MAAEEREGFRGLEGGVVRWERRRSGGTRGWEEEATEGGVEAPRAG